MSSEDEPGAGTPAGDWRCAVCGQAHSGLATVFGPSAPDPWVSASSEQRSAGELTPDQCVLPDGATTHHFIRGHIEIPVVDRPGTTFVWSAWASLSEANMDLTSEHWEDPDRASLPPMFGWLCTALEYEPPTLSLPTHVHTRDPGVVPSIELDPGLDHPLAVEQREGITWHRVAEINARLLR